MAHQYYVTIKGSQQGVFKSQGSGPKKGRIPIVYFEFDVVSPRSASGSSTGKRQHKPVIFKKLVDAASPQLFESLVTNEILSVEFEFNDVGPNGKESVYYTVTLINASVAALKQSVHVGEQGGPVVEQRFLDEVTLTYQKIEIADIPGKTSASDDWLDSV
jgi:type VI secretion system secreted protein Hcp